MKWFMWKRSTRGPVASVIWDPQHKKPEMLKEDKKSLIGDLVQILEEHESLPIVELMKIYPCPPVPKDN
jgi:hypothetical protein